MREPAPADLSTEVIGVPEGSELELDLRLESVLEGILVTGTVRALAIGECARCLERLERPLEVDLQELFAYPGHESEDAGVVEGDLIDLEPAVRDAVVTELPLAPVCRDDCPGLCPECGALLADDPGHAHDLIDPRWAALEAILETGDTTGTTSTGGAADSTTASGSANGTTTNTSTTHSSAGRTSAATMNDDRRVAGGHEES